MSSKLKYIIFFGAIFGLLGFAHSIRCSDTPIISSLVGWLTICTAVFYFALAVNYRQAIYENESIPLLVGALIFSALQHAYIYIDAYWLESVVSGMFFLLFYYGLGKAVDG